MIRVFCARCGVDLDEGRGRCDCEPPLATVVSGEPARFEVHVRRYAALRKLGLSERAAQRLAPPDRVPS